MKINQENNILKNLSGYGKLSVILGIISIISIQTVFITTAIIVGLLTFFYPRKTGNKSAAKWGIAGAILGLIGLLWGLAPI